MKTYALGINYDASMIADPDEAFRLFAELGFDNLFTMYTGDAVQMNRFAELAAKHGLFYDCLHAPFKHINDIWSEDDAAGEAMLGQLIDSVKCCSSLGIPQTVVHLSSGVHAPAVSDIGHRRYDRLIDAAVRYGVKVDFENQRKLGNIAFVMELYEDVEQVGFCWDVGHEMCFTNGRRYMPLFGNRLSYTHIHDNFCKFNGDCHMIPFDGMIDFNYTAKAIAVSGYTGALTLELIPNNSREYVGVDARTYYTRAYAAAVKLRFMVMAEEKAKD